MGFLSCCTHRLAGNENPNTGGRESTNNKSWHVPMVELLKFLPIVNWDGKLVGRMNWQV